MLVVTPHAFVVPSVLGVACMSGVRILMRMLAAPMLVVVGHALMRRGSFNVSSCSPSRQEPDYRNPAMIGHDRSRKEYPIENVIRISAIVPVEEDAAHGPDSSSGDNIARPVLILVETREPYQRRHTIARRRHVARRARP
jgi:hypothetical protein